jgi:hypothetical protein
MREAFSQMDDSRRLTFPSISKLGIDVIERLHRILRFAPMIMMVRLLLPPK